MNETSLFLISYLNIKKEEDEFILNNYPEIHERCNKLIMKNLDKYIKYRNIIYFKYNNNLSYPIIKYYNQI